MAKVVSYVNAFTAGEIGPDAWERTDLQQHAKGCDSGFNLIGKVAGPQVSRGGFWDRGSAHSNSYPARIVGFSRSTGDAWFLEFGQYVMRVRNADGALVLDDADEIFELETVWTAAQAQRLWFKAINDVLYITDLDGGPPRVLNYRGPTDWFSDGFGFADGPWLGEDPYGATLTLDLGGGTVTSSAARFVASDVNSLLQFREGDGSPGWDTWTSATEYTVGTKVQFDGRVYERVAGGTGTKSGTTPPLHQSGILSDGKLLWEFKHDGRGVLKIIGFNSTTEVEVEVVRPGPTVTTTAYWSLQAYNNTLGYPRALVAERDERLIIAASLAQPGVVDMTRTAGFGRNFGDFKPGLGTGRVVDDDAVRLDVGGTERVVWVLSAGVLIAGCTDGEYVLSGSTMDEGITPLARQARPISAFGNADVRPLKIQGPPLTVLHVLGSRQTLRDTRFAPDLSVDSHDRSVLAHHIFERGVADMCWQQPDNLIWLKLDDGGLAAMTFHQEQEVYGATRQPLPIGDPELEIEGWEVESVDTARAAGGDVVMVAVKRIKEGATQRRIWRLAKRSEGNFIEGALRYTGAPATVISGLGVYEGEAVTVLADGAEVTGKVVEDGSITLPDPASDVIVGQGLWRRFVSLPLDLEGVGSTNARTILPTHATVTLSCVDALVGTDAPQSAERVQTRSPDDLTAPIARRVRKRVGLGGGADRDRRLVIETRAPFDLQIHAYRLEAEVTS